MNHSENPLTLVCMRMIMVMTVVMIMVVVIMMTVIMVVAAATMSWVLKSVSVVRRVRTCIV